MEYSLFMIKPCAYRKKEEILNIIQEKLNVLCTYDLVLEKEFLSKFYKYEENEIFNKNNQKFLCGKTVCIGIVEGENAIDELIKLCGDKPRGSDCDKTTIRYKFAPDEEVLHLDNGEIFYVNAIHKASPEEAADQITVFLQLFITEELRKYNQKRKEEMSQIKY